ncbi:Major facilitator superfamily domain-containing protein [Dirofilaria immitis]
METNEEGGDVGAESYTNGVGGQVETVDTPNELNGCQVFGYGIGHFYNDMCASMWFTYLLLFLEKVIIIRSSVAGLIMLIGQTTDALSTAFIGILSDSTSVPLCFRHCGQRKSWHALGTVLVTFSFAFIYNKCFICGQSTTDWELFAWYVPYVIVFQIGWAAVQISHLALLPELTYDVSRRTTMNSVRHGFTVVANLIIFAILSVLLYSDDSGSAIGPVDLWNFNIVAGMVIVLGLFTGIIFYAVTKEPSRNYRIIVSVPSRYQFGILRAFKLSLRKWMCRLQFYQVGILYVLCRMYINVSQVYFPFYITHLPNLSKKYVAILPMISYCSSFLVSALIGLSFINRRCSLENLALFGCLCGISNCLVIQFDIYFPVYTIAVLLGVAQAVLLITSLSAVAKLINQDTESSAFVYGTLSSMDKISSGLVLQMIELFSPFSCMASESTVNCTSFYQTVVVVVPSSCLLITFFILLSLIISEKWSSLSQ